MRGAEVVIVGAGPAGSAAALLLARQRRDVLLLDQARFPRDKPCGEYLNPAAVAIIRRWGLEEVLRGAGARQVAGLLLTSPAGRVLRMPFPAAGGRARWGLSLPRLALDAALLEAARTAGARVQEGFRVDDLLRAGEHVVGVEGRGEHGAETIHAGLVLAADGTRSVVARRLRLARETGAPRRFGLVAHFTGVEGDDWVEMHAGRHGYCGLGFSADGGANVAMVAESADLPRLRGRAEAFFAERLAEFPAVARRLRRGSQVGRLLVTGSMSSRVAAAAAPGVLLVGDAAGFYDPYTGEGLSYALRGAELAAETADTALSLNLMPAKMTHRDAEDPESGREGIEEHRPSLGPLRLCGSLASASVERAAFREYAARRRAEFAPRVRVSRSIQFVLRRPWLLEAVFRRFDAEPELAQQLIGVTAGILPARAVLAPAYLARLALLPS